MTTTGPARTEPSAFDCVDLKRRIHQEVRRETAGLTPSEEVEWARRRALQGPLSAWWRRVVQRSRTTAG
jgi:hypothetical protein